MSTLYFGDFCLFPILTPRQTSGGPEQQVDLNQSYLVFLCSKTWKFQKLNKRSANDRKMMRNDEITF